MWEVIDRNDGGAAWLEFRSGHIMRVIWVIAVGVFPPFRWSLWKPVIAHEKRFHFRLISNRPNMSIWWVETCSRIVPYLGWFLCCGSPLIFTVVILKCSFVLMWLSSPQWISSVSRCIECSTRPPLLQHPPGTGRMLKLSVKLRGFASRVASAGGIQGPRIPIMCSSLVGNQMEHVFDLLHGSWEALELSFNGVDSDV